MLLLEMLKAKGTLTAEEYHRNAKTLTRMDIITLKK